MEIFRSFTGVRQQYAGKNRDIRGLQKAEVLADMFNNVGPEDEKEEAVKVRLSYISRALLQDLRDGVSKFLKENPGLSKSLAAIRLPDEDASRPHQREDLSVRKLGVYLTWLEMGGPTANEGEEDHSPYFAIHEEGLDGEIREIFEENHRKQGEVRANRHKNNPNYFYLIYPETYAFN